MPLTTPLANRLELLLNLSPIISKLIFYVVISGALFLIVEPERIKPCAYISFAIIMSITYLAFFDNIRLIFTNGVNFGNINLFDFEYTGEFTGITSYSFEAAGSYMSSILRNTIY